nr:unnamed protein product [Digitaria exilis]
MYGVEVHAGTNDTIRAYALRIREDYRKNSLPNAYFPPSVAVPSISVPSFRCIVHPQFTAEEEKMAEHQKNKLPLTPIGERIGSSNSKKNKPPLAYGGVELRMLHCTVADCSRPLEPPFFKAAHRLCRGDDGRCLRCGLDDITFVHRGPDYVGAFTARCRFVAYGCASAFLYDDDDDAAAHRDACAYAPCPCAVAGCAFTASPPVLRGHLAAEHSWPVHTLPGYETPVDLLVPAPGSGTAHHLLAVDGDELRACGVSGWAITVACVRASGAAEAGPRYGCDLLAAHPTRKNRCQMLVKDVTSCAALDERMPLAMPHLMLRGPSEEIHLEVVIAVVNPAPSLADPGAGGALMRRPVRMEAAEAAPTSEPPPPPPPTEGARRSGKRARDEGPLLFGVRLIEHDGTQDELVQAEAAQEVAEAIVPSGSPAAAPPAAVQVDKARLYCSLCSSLLKPPIYQVRIKPPPPLRRRCAVGHVACCRCRVKLPDSGCRTCGAAASAYKHCLGLDLFFGDLRVPCRYAEYGCESFVPYFRSDEHRDACCHAPCHCPEPGCYLVSSPRELAAHLAGDHSWPADEIAYGTPRMLPIPMPPPPPVSSSSPAPARHLRLLRGDDDDASVFVVAVGTLGDGAAMSVVLVRANSPAHPRFVCTFCVKPPTAAEGLEGDGDCCFFGSVPVRSSALADDDGVAPEKEVYFAVPGEMLCEGGGGGGRELLVSVRIDRSRLADGCEAGARPDRVDGWGGQATGWLISMLPRNQAQGIDSLRLSLPSPPASVACRTGPKRMVMAHAQDLRWPRNTATDAQGPHRQDLPASLGF